MRLVRIQDAFKELGRCRSGGYADIKKGLIPRPVKTSPRSSALPDFELEALARAKIAGMADDEVRALVVRLETARKSVAP
jgi:prophage regulatory protein